MSEILNQEVEAKVSKVVEHGLFLVLFNSEKAFLPKENMYIGKKKKLVDIFSEGFIIKARVARQKEDYYILTQKKKSEANKQIPLTKIEKKKKLKKEISKSKKQEVKNIKLKTQEIKQTESKEVEQKKTTLKELKKLQYIGNMKISVGSGRKLNIRELSKEKEEVKEYLEIPEHFLEDMIMSTDSANKKFEEVVLELQKRGYLDEN